MKVLSLGQCAADHYALSRLLRDQFKADVDAVDAPAAALAALREGQYALILVNRLLDRGGSGLDFISRLKADPALASTPVMLVSDYADAQQQAADLGAAPGFGKSNLHRPETTDRLASVLASTKSPD